MSKHFAPVEFDLGVDPGLPAPPPPVAVFNLDKVKEAVAAIEKEFERIKAGTSEFCHYAFDPGRFANPVGENLRRFAADPTQKTLEGFIQVAKQDICMAAAIHFNTLLESTKETPNG